MKTKGKEKRNSGAGKRERRKAAPEKPRRRRRKSGVTLSTAARQIAVDAREIAGATNAACETVADVTREIADVEGKIDKIVPPRRLS